MTMFDNKQPAKICVAVKFEETGHVLLKTAEEVCRRTGSSMHLVHVCESISAGNMAALASTSMAPIPLEILEQAEEQSRVAAQIKLTALAQKIPADIKHSTKVLINAYGPGEMIEAEAMSQGCSLIVVGANPAASSYRFLPRGFSCALSLMASAKMPVMVVKPTAESHFGNRVKMVVADDLKSPSLPSVMAACDLAVQLRNVELCHIHINGMTPDAISAAFESAMASSHSRPNPAMAPEEMFIAMTNVLEERLKERLKTKANVLKRADCHYDASIVTADSVVEGIGKIAEQEKANLVVFGRHQTFHRKPFGVGQMPYYAMLTLPCPIVIVPISDRF